MGRVAKQETNAIGLVMAWWSSSNLYMAQLGRLSYDYHDNTVTLTIEIC